MTKKVISTVYAEADDVTFIMEESETGWEVKGFYFGSPDEQATKQYYGKLTAEFSVID